MPSAPLPRSPRLALAAAALAAGCASSSPEVTEVRLSESRAPAGTVATSDPEPPDSAPATHPRRERTNESDPPPGGHPTEADLEMARQLFQDGAAAYANADYQTACHKFQEAYDLVPNQALLFNLGSCELKMGRTAKACAHFRTYVQRGDPADPRIQQVSAQVANRCP